MQVSSGNAYQSKAKYPAKRRQLIGGVALGSGKMAKKKWRRENEAKKMKSVAAKMKKA